MIRETAIENDLPEEISLNKFTESLLDAAQGYGDETYNKVNGAIQSIRFKE
jgi:hypothetical protein